MTAELVSAGKTPQAEMDKLPTERETLPAELNAMTAQLRALCNGQARLTQAVLAQQAEIARLNRALGMMRVTRTQEAAMQAAIRARARMLAASEGLAGSETRIAAAIRTTLRETTGARAVGDIQASQYEAAMQLVTGWAMAGALRRIRREREAQA